MRLQGRGFREDDEALATVTAFLMVFGMSVVIMTIITLAIMDNPMEQGKEVSRYEYRIVANDMASSIEEMAHAAQRDPEMYQEREIVLHHNIRGIEYTINVTTERVKLKSSVEDIIERRNLVLTGNIEVEGELSSSSALVLLIYEPGTNAIVLTNQR